MAGMDKSLRRYLKYLDSMEGSFYWQHVINQYMHILISLKNVTFRHKLQGRDDHIVNGVELVKEAWPNSVGWAADILHEYKNDLNFLRMHGYIVIGVAREGPYGYGDDQLYILTEDTQDYITEKRHSELRRHLLRDLLKGEVDDTI